MTTTLGVFAIEVGLAFIGCLLALVVYHVAIRNKL